VPGTGDDKDKEDSGLTREEMKEQERLRWDPMILLIMKSYVVGRRPSCMRRSRGTSSTRSRRRRERM
jgi:hypothetical protein